MLSANPISPTILNNNAGWCWFQGERAIIHGNQLYLGSVACKAGVDGANRHGNIELVQCDLISGKITRSVLHEHLQDDDHDSPAVHIREDGCVLAIYTRHSNDGLKRWRISESPGDISRMGTEQTFEMPARVCYSNIYRVGGRLYDFNRSVGNNPNYNVSDDDGATWRYGGRLLNWPLPVGDPKYTGMDGTRPYLRYASDGMGIHVFATEDHPRAYDNSLYHGVIRDGSIHGSDGKLIAPLSANESTRLKPTDLTKIFGGDADHVAWCSDIRVDCDGLPYAAFSVQVNDGKHRHDRNAGGEDLRYFYGRFDGSRWQVHPLAYAGHRLYASENDYSGLVTLHPHRRDAVYFSTSADPASGTPLISSADGKRHYELYRGRTDDDGKTWAFKALTRNSTMDHLRPIIPPGDPERTIVLWCRGTLKTYTDYDLQAVAIEDSLS